jgi:hypothetical protein
VPPLGIGAVDPEGSCSKKSICNQRVGWKIRSAQFSEWTGWPHLTVAIHFARESNATLIADDHQFEGWRERGVFGGANEAGHFGNQVIDY